MTKRISLFGGGALTVTAAASVVALAGGSAAAATVAATPDRVVNRETVQVEASSTGDVDHARLFSQLTVYGDGTYRVADPTATDGLRNLDGFASPDVVDGEAVWTITSKGRADRRTVADVPASKLPVTLEASYTLDGKAISPSDLVGKTGEVTATYTVVNDTATPTAITYRDGHGKTVTETIDLVTPLVGQLQTDLPKSFTALKSDRADLAGDGHGGTIAAFTLVLFGPIGAPAQSFGWTAHVSDAELPPATLQVLPVVPERHPELKTGQDGYEEGAATGAELTDGAGVIDGHLVELRDGAAKLLSGLSQLADGASQLQDGLAGKAAPGSRQLADGVAQIDDGARQLRDGVGAKLSDSQKLADGAGQVDDGASSLYAGLGDVSAGLAVLADDASGLPAAVVGAQTLRAGVDQLLAGLGDPSNPKTIFGGLKLVSDGLSGLADEDAGLPAARGGVDAIRQDLLAATGTAGTAISTLGSGVTAAQQLVNAAKSSLDPATQATAIAQLTQAAGALSQVNAGLTDLATTLATKVTEAADGLDSVSKGLTHAIEGVGQLQYGVGAITEGVTRVKLGLSSGSAAQPGLAEGLDALITGLGKAVYGVGALNAGVAGAALPGAAALADGAGLVAGGTAQSAQGLTELHGHLGDLAAGTAEASAGAGELASGLGDAASGSGQLADGLRQAAGGGSQIVDGAGRLHTEGTSQLVEAGNATATKFGREYAIMKALDAKGVSEALPYGAPQGGTGTAAYLYTLAAADKAMTEGVQRGAAALVVALLAAVGSGWVIRRRMVGAVAA
jgi:putative membrane protein